jgi:hypothetical protein
MFLPLAKAVFTFVVIVVSLNAVAVPVYAFFAALWLLKTPKAAESLEFWDSPP